jgi:hypothetical protein
VLIQFKVTIKNLENVIIYADDVEINGDGILRFIEYMIDEAPVITAAFKDWEHFEAIHEDDEEREDSERDFEK